MNQEESSILWRNFFDITDGMRELGRKITDNGTVLRLTLNQLRMIQHVRILTRENNDEGITLKQLVETLGITAAAGSEMVDSLVRKEVLVRKQSRTDRRSLSLRLAGRWEEYFRANEESFSGLAGQFLLTLSEKEREGILNLSAAFASFIKNERLRKTEKKTL